MANKVSELKACNIDHDIIDQILFEGMEDTGESLDWILVLGSNKAREYRIPKALELLHEGRADKLLLSGGRIIEVNGQTGSEARHMANAAMAKGISDKMIYLEEASLYTLDNMVKSYEILKALEGFDKIRTIGLVTTHYHMRRSLLMAYQVFPKWLKIIPCPANDRSTRRETWHLSDQGRKRTRQEVGKIIECINAGLIDDFEIKKSCIIKDIEDTSDE